MPDIRCDLEDDAVATCSAQLRRAIDLAVFVES